MKSILLIVLTLLTGSVYSQSVDIFLNNPDKVLSIIDPNADDRICLIVPPKAICLIPIHSSASAVGNKGKVGMEMEVMKLDDINATRIKASDAN